MKIFKYGLPFAALAMLASCANDNMGDPTPNPTPEAKGNVFMNLRLSIPSGASSRAESFNDGTADEYAVEDGKLFIFEETSNNPGKCIAVVTLDFTDPEGKVTPGTVNITKTLDINKIQLPANVKKEEGTNYYALAILNTKYINCPVVNTSTWASWSTDDQKISEGYKMMDSEKKHFTMTNALGYSGTIAENSKPSVLVPFTSTDLYYESDNPKANPIKIYVQRVVSKVTLGDSNFEIGGNYVGLNGEAAAANADQVKLTNWYLDVENVSTYPVQLLENESNSWAVSPLIGSWNSLSGNNERFLGSDASFKRVYWAVDPNYSKSEGTPTVNPSSTNAKDKVFYPFENTFNLECMIQSQSTRIVFEGVYNVGGETTAPSFFSYNGRYKAIKTLKSGAPTASSATAKLEDFVEGDELKDLSSYFNVAADAEVLNYHHAGQVFYTAIIRHFEDSELDPENELEGWELKSEDYLNIPDSETVKGDKYLLGRYGMVRNNWYEVVVKTVTGPGDPIVPTPGNTPDDKPAKYYLDADINVLSWALRSHDYDL